MKSEEHERVCVNYRTSQHHYQKIFLLINTLIHFHRSLGENIFRRIPHTHSTFFILHYQWVFGITVQQLESSKLYLFPVKTANWLTVVTVHTLLECKTNK